MKYKIIKQKPYCCVGACIEMILNRRNIDNKGQVFIACELGLIVPSSYKELYPNAIIGDKPSAGYGTQIQKEEFSINQFFKKNNINLVMENYYIISVDEAKEFLLNNFSNDIIICLYGATLYDDLDASWGHMVLFENIEDNEVTILDPYKDKYIKIDIKKLIEAIKVHGKNNAAGFYLIK